MTCKPLNLVIARLDPAIHSAVEHHLLRRFWTRPISMDARVKPPHDE
jgi:hypothetical protein